MVPYHLGNPEGGLDAGWAFYQGWVIKQSEHPPVQGPDMTRGLDCTDFSFLCSSNHFQAAVSPTWEIWPLFMELVCKLRLWGPCALSRGKSGWWHWPRIYVNAKKNLDWVLEHPCSSSSCNIQWLSTSGKPSWPCKSLWAISFLS